MGGGTSASRGPGAVRSIPGRGPGRGPAGCRGILRPAKPAEAAFLALGEGAKLYLVEAAACGARRVEARMAEAVALGALHGGGVVDHALGVWRLNRVEIRASVENERSRSLIERLGFRFEGMARQAFRLAERLWAIRNALGR